MTVIIGYHDRKDGRLYVGADSLVCSGTDCDTIEEPKVFRKGAALIGCSGDVRHAKILKYHLKMPDHMPGVDTKTYLATTFVRAVRAVFTEEKAAKVDNSVETSQAWFVIAYNGVLAKVDGDYCCRFASYNYVCHGSGRSQAIVALSALERYSMPPRERIRAVMEAVAEHHIYVRAPFKIMSVVAP